MIPAHWWTLLLEVEIAQGHLGLQEGATWPAQAPEPGPSALVDAQLADIVPPEKGGPLGREHHRVAAGRPGDQEGLGAGDLGSSAKQHFDSVYEDRTSEQPHWIEPKRAEGYLGFPMTY
uniref:Uncharacterized protein n=1 Tax=Salvator merianae TaxID=96440 RepID=A0A8D0B3Z9_SALMN